MNDLLRPLSPPLALPSIAYLRGDIRSSEMRAVPNRLCLPPPPPSRLRTWRNLNWPGSICVSVRLPVCVSMTFLGSLFSTDLILPHNSSSPTLHPLTLIHILSSVKVRVR